MIHDKTSVHPAVEGVRQSLTEAIAACSGAGVLPSSGLMTDLKDMLQRTVEIQRELGEALNRPDVVKQVPRVHPGRGLPSLDEKELVHYCQGITVKDLMYELGNVGRLGSSMVMKIAELQRSRKVKPGLNKYLNDLAEVEGTEMQA